MSNTAHTILIVDDDEDILTAGKLLLKREFGYVHGCSDPNEIPSLLSANQFDAILLDMNFSPGESSGEQGFLWLQRILELDPDAVVIMITAHGSMDLAVEAMKLGATDFVGKPWQNEKVIATLSAAVKLRASRAENVFMSVDLGAVSETLFESELFGHRKGAFTGANSDRIGRLEAANGGTLFLDEIGNIPLHLQAKLLTVLEQRRVTPVGSNESIRIDVRVISATNVPRDQLADESRFRQDLLFRLNTVELTLPPLRERREDIAEIATHYASLYARKYHKPELSFSPGALEAMQEYDWPGNVRALRHAVERAVILAESGTYELGDLQLTGKGGEAAAPQVASQQATPDDLNLERVEKRTIESALKQHRYNISHAAKELGLTRAALYRRMEKHGL